MADNGDGVTVIELEGNEVALIVGEEDGAMSVRVAAARELPDANTDIPAAHEIAIALAMRLLRDPDFHDEVLDWYYSQPEEDEDEEEGREEPPSRR